MKTTVLLFLAAAVLSVGGCARKSNTTPAPAATNSVPMQPTTNGPVHKPGSGV